MSQSSDDFEVLASAPTEEIINELQARIDEFRRRLGAPATPAGGEPSPQVEVVASENFLTPAVCREMAVELLKEAVERERVFQLTPDPGAPVTFACMQCGTTKESKVKGAARKLKCSECGRATEHVALDREQAPPKDWREDANTRTNAAELLRHASWLEDTCRELGIHLDEEYLSRGHWEEQAARIHRESGRRTVWAVDINPHLTLERRVHYLKLTLQAIATGVDHWADPDDYWSPDGEPDVARHGRKWDLQPGDTVDDALAEARRRH